MSGPRPGRVVETRGRRVLVADDEGERVCFLSGQRAVVGDWVRWVEAKGSGGKLVGVERRETSLVRADSRGREQVLVSNLEGLLIVAAAQAPPFRAGLVDRYVVAAAVGGLRAAVLLNKCDLGVPDEVEAALAVRVAAGVPTIRVSAHTGDGLSDLRAHLAAADGPWALVGHSGVGKTSLVAALLPDTDVGGIGDLSEYWGTGQHTTTSSRVFALPEGGELIDSPGIRTFAPRIDAPDAGRHFPGMGPLGCKYRDCLHRPDEQGCVAEDDVDPQVLASYRRLVNELLDIEDRKRR